jgi:hypothetical protein
MDALIDALVKRRTRPGEAEAAKAGRRPICRKAEGRLGLTGEQADLKGALDVAGILQGNAFAGSRIEGEELADFFFETLGGELAAEFGVARRQGIEAMGEGLQVETRTADDNGSATTGDDLMQSWQGQLMVALGVTTVCGAEGAKKVVWMAGALLGGGFGGDDVKAGVKLKGVCIDDLAVQDIGEVERGGGFSRGGGANEKEGLRGRGLRRHQEGWVKKSPSHMRCDGLWEVVMRKGV